MNDNTQPQQTTRAQQADAITGVEAMMGKGVKKPLGFWSDAWAQVIRRPGAVLGLSWVAIVALLAIFAPLIASGHPAVMRTIDTRTGADAAEAVAAALDRLEAVSPQDLNQALRLELKDHAPSLTTSDILGDTAPPTTPVEVFDETGRATTKNALSPDDLAVALQTIRSSSALDESGGIARTTSPLISNLSAADIVILLGTLAAAAALLAPSSVPRSTRTVWILLASAQATVFLLGSLWVESTLGSRNAPTWLRDLQSIGLNDNPAPDDWRWFVTALVTILSAATTLLFTLIPSDHKAFRRLAVHAATSLIVSVAVGFSWGQPPERFDYPERERLGEVEATYTLVPFSPNERLVDRNAAELPPGSTTDQALARRITTGLPFRGPIGPESVDSLIAAAKGLPTTDDARTRLIDGLSDASQQLPDDTREKVTKERRKAATKSASSDDETPQYVEPQTLADLRVGEAEDFAESLLAGEGRTYILGSDASGKDVLSQLLHACRLSVSIGIVATGIAAAIGITLGAIMGYFGGIIDLALYRVVEIFMAIPVLFLLIVAAAVLPRNTYVMMAIIGCFTWHSIARFTRAEFLKLRNQDFVQSAQAVGLPLQSVLFKHMLPNGVTPVLVDASFRIAAAILFETILSYLDLGPEDQPSWGRLLYDATRGSQAFVWWLALFPGFAIFLTVLGYNLIGEALRDAIDPKLKKARV